MNPEPSCKLPALAPYDRFFLASSLALMERGLPGHHVFAHLSLHGPLDLQLLRTRLVRTLNRHPILKAGIMCSGLTKQPRWTIHADIVTLPLEEVALLDSPDPAAERDAILRTAAQERQDPSRGPLLCLWVFRMGHDRYDLVLRWPHYLMDLAGGERVLTEIAAEDHQHLAKPPAPSSLGLFRSLAAWCRGMWYLRRVNFLKGNRLKSTAKSDILTVETLRRCWSEEQTAAIDAAAKASCHSGPLLHTRWHIASVVRAADAVFARADVHRREHYLISLPQRRVPPRLGVMTGNDLTIGTLILHRDALTDLRATDDALASQLADHDRRQLADAHEMTTAFPGRFPLPLYVWLLKKFRIFPRYSIGFSAYRVDDMSNGFLGCRVEDFSFWTVPPSPPGIIATFCRFRGKLSLGLTYFSNVCSPETAFNICNELERQLRLAHQSCLGKPK